MDSVERNIDQLFDKARQAPVKLTPQQVQLGLVSSAALGVLAIGKSIGKFKILSIMLGSTVAIISTVVALNTTTENKNELNHYPESNSLEVTTTKSSQPYEAETKTFVVEKVEANEDVSSLNRSEIVPLELVPELNHVSPFPDMSFAPNEKKEVGAFHSVIVNIPVDVELFKGNTCQTEVLQEDLVDMISFTVKNGVMTVDLKNGSEKDFYKKTKGRIVEVELTMPSIQAITLNGSGDIHSDDEIPSKDLQVKLNGSGDILLHAMKPTSYDIQLVGSGDVAIKGEATATKGRISLTGSGDVCTRTLMSDDVQVSISGSGDVVVAASKTLDVKIAGSGDVSYSGDPETNVSISGSGEVHKGCQSR